MNEALLFFLRTLWPGNSSSVARLYCAIALPQRLYALIEFVRRGSADALISAYFNAQTPAAIAYWRGRVSEFLASISAQNDIFFARDIENMRALSEFNDLITLKIAFEVYVNEGKERLHQTMRTLVDFEGVEIETLRRVAHIEAFVFCRPKEAALKYMQALFEVYRAPSQTREETLALVFSHLKANLRPSETHKHLINSAYEHKRREWLERAR